MADLLDSGDDGDDWLEATAGKMANAPSAAERDIPSQALARWQSLMEAANKPEAFNLVNCVVGPVPLTRDGRGLGGLTGAGEWLRGLTGVVGRRPDRPWTDRAAGRGLTLTERGGNRQGGAGRDVAAAGLVWRLNNSCTSSGRSTATKKEDGYR